MEAHSSLDGSPSSSLDNTVTNDVLKRLNKKYLRIVVSGKTIEAYWSMRPVLLKRVCIKKNPKKKINKKRQDEYAAWSTHRARNTVRRLAIANFDRYNSKLLTLTFADTQEFDVTSPEKCHPKLKLFLVKLKRRYPHFRYIAAGEFQTKNNRMAVHYHLLVNLPYVKQEKLKRLWKLGTVDIRMGDHNHINKVTYITKYITKENTFRYKKRRYFTSKGLKKPFTLYGDRAKLFLEKCISYGWKGFAKKPYQNEFMGETECVEYNPDRITPAPKE